jgi:nucleoside-diphosphate-sugar epimerase
VRVFVAGAAGAIGRPLMPMLVAAGHEVTGTTRSTERAAWLESVGAHPAIVNAYDRDAIASAVADARPEVVINQLTDLTKGFAVEDVVKTQRIREVAGPHLLDAAVAAGSRRLISQSGAWLYADGPIPHDESHPFRQPTTEPRDASLRGIIELERLTLGTPGIEGVVLRYGFFYGPGTAYELAAYAPEPRVGVEAAARATAAAVEHGPAGIYNVVDDNDRVSNARARDHLGWQP